MTRRRGSALESTGEQIVDPRLDVFRDFVNSLDLDGERDARGARPDSAGQAGPGYSPRTGSPRSQRPLRGCPQPQPQRTRSRGTARKTTRGFAPVGEPAVRG